MDTQLVGDLLVGVALVGAEEDLEAVLLLAGQGPAASCSRDSRCSGVKLTEKIWGRAIATSV